MKFLDYLFHGKELRYIDSYFKMLNGYSPTFTSYNGGVYEMDLTRTAVNSFATHCSKLKPEIEGSALKSLEKTLQHKPNYFMDTEGNLMATEQAMLALCALERLPDGGCVYESKYREAA